MKKRGIIVIGITFLVLSVIIGIASLPDEVLIESTTVENSQTMSDAQAVPINEEINNFIIKSEVDKNLENAKAELDALKKELRELKKDLVELKTASNILEETPTSLESQEEVSEEQSMEETEGKVIRINIKDGVGAEER